MRKIFTCAIMVISCLSACKEKPSGKGVSRLNATELYKDSVFLEIKGGDLNALFFESKVDPKIYYPAVNRIRRYMSLENDSIRINLKSGAEIKISENIFDYLRSGIMQDNRRVLTDTNYEVRINTLDGGYNVCRKDMPNGYIGLKKLSN